MSRWMLIGGIASTIYGFGNLYHPTVVVGDSMAPTLMDGRMIYVDRFYYQKHRPQRGEVVVFRHGPETYVKRVYRGPGELLHYIATPSSWVGLVQDASVEDARRRYTGGSGRFEIQTMRVPEDSVYVLGDNFTLSEDSRQIGPVPIRQIIGRAHVEVDATKTRSFEIGSDPLRPERRRTTQESTHLTAPRESRRGDSG